MKQIRKRDSLKVKVTVETIRQEIIAGKYPAGSLLPTREQLVKTYSTSRVTIQKSINQLVAENFIETNGRNGTFVTKTPPHKYQIALVIYENAVNSMVYNSIQKSIKRIEKETSYRFKIYTFLNEYKQQVEIEALHDDLKDNLFAGLFSFYIRTFQLEEYHIYDHENIPMMFLIDDRDDIEGYQKPHINFISFSHEKLIDAAIEQLKFKNIKKVAWIVNKHFQDKCQVHLMKACAENNLHTEPYWVQGAGLDQLDYKWMANIVQLLVSSNPPEAIVVLNENLLDSVISGLHQSRVKVPDDIELISHFSFPIEHNTLLSITKIGFDIYKLFMNVIDITNDLKKNPGYAEHWVNHIEVAE